MPPARSGLGVSVVNGLLYAVGGHNTSVVGQAFATVEAYEPTTNAWTTKAPMPAADYWFGVGVVNGVLYAPWAASGAQACCRRWKRINRS